MAHASTKRGRWEGIAVIVTYITNCQGGVPQPRSSDDHSITTTSECQKTTKNRMQRYFHGVLRENVSLRVGEHGKYCLKRISDLPSHAKSTKKNAIQSGCSEEGCAVELTRLIGIPEAPRERIQKLQFVNFSFWAYIRYRHPFRCKPHIAFFLCFWLPTPISGLDLPP